MHSNAYISFLNQARGPKALRAWFLDIVSSANVGACPPPRPLITNHVKGMRNNRIGHSFTPPPFLYTTFAVDKLNRRGLSNTARLERLPKKTKDGY